jgi:transposase
MNTGESHTKIALILGVGRASLYRWRAMSQKADDGLRSIPYHGHARELNPTQFHELEYYLCQGAKAHGWHNELWTSQRVTTLIQQRFGVTYHEGHVRKLLKHLLHWTSQKPECRARERDEAEIKRWANDEFPLLKKRPRTAAQR